MASKSIQDMQSEMITAINSLVPELDLSVGSPERDIFVEAPISGQLVDIWSKLNYTNYLFAPIANYQYLQDTDVDMYCANFGVKRIAALKASGYVLFYSNSMPTSDIIIPSGALIATKSSPAVYFNVPQTFTVSAGSLVSYFNASTNRWEFSVYVEAQTAGSTSRAGVNTITSVEDYISGITGVTNTSAITGGSDAETNYTLLQRLMATFQSRGLLNNQGISSYASNYASSVLVVGAGNSLMTRDMGRGGMIDVYVKDLLSASQVDTFTITSTGLVSSYTSGYSSTFLILKKPPVNNVTQLQINGKLISSEYYSLVKDTGSLSRSTSSVDKVVLTSTGIAAITGFSSGDIITVGYDYNKLLYDIATDLDSSTNKILGRNYLVRELYPKSISISFYAAPTSNSTIDSLSSTWDAVLSTYLTGLSYGASITKAGLITVINNISTVSNLDITRLYFCYTEDGVPSELNTIDPLVLSGNCYPVLGATAYSLWTA